MDELIWNAINTSAKTKFNYNSFESNFDDFGSKIPDNILFLTIIGFASEKKEEIIALEIFNQLLMTGMNWPIDDIKQFIKGKNSLLKKEIYCAKLASSMLNENSNSLSVLDTVSKLLK